MSSSKLTLVTADGPMPAFQATAGGEAKGAIVVIQEGFGLTRHIEEVVGRLAGAGWLALAPALFHREGSPVFSYDDTTAGHRAVLQLTREGIETDLGATFEHLEAEGFRSSRQGIVGFCVGG